MAGSSGPAVRAAVNAVHVCLRSDSCTPAERIADVPQVQVCGRERSARSAAPVVPLLTAPRRPARHKLRAGPAQDAQRHHAQDLCVPPRQAAPACNPLRVADQRWFARAVKRSATMIGHEEGLADLLTGAQSLMKTHRDHLVATAAARKARTVAASPKEELQGVVLSLDRAAPPREVRAAAAAAATARGMWDADRAACSACCVHAGAVLVPRVRHRLRAQPQRPCR